MAEQAVQTDVKQPQQPVQKGERFYDSKFSIEEMQHEPYEGGFTWRTALGAVFIAFVMLPGVIFMGLMIGQDLGTAAEWVTIILFVELARRSFIVLRKQELYMLKYTVSHLTHIAGGLALGGGIFAGLVWQRYLRTSEAFKSFGIAGDLPKWVAPQGEAVYLPFHADVWWPVIGVTVGAMLLSKLTQLSLGWLAYKVTVDGEKLPFPLAPIHAEGAIALAERSSDTHKKGFRQYCFSTGVIIGAVFGLLYMGVPTLTKAFLDKPIQLLPIPFLDLTVELEQWLHGGTFGIAIQLGLIFTGFVMPWRVMVGAFVTCMLMQLVVNPFILQPYGFLPSWQPGKDAIETQVATQLDLYMSVGIGTAFAIFVVGVYGLVRSVLRYRRSSGSGEIDIQGILRRDKARGDPPVWAAFVVWIAAAIGFIILADRLVNAGLPKDERFSLWWFVAFAFIWTPINTYINARMIGIAGQGAGMPFVSESAIFISGYKYVDIWFAPMPIANYGGMAELLRVTQLTRTKFTSILKAELLIFPLMMIASFIYWSYITGLGPIPSDTYPFVQKFWPQIAQMKAVWASSMQEGASLFERAIKPDVIVFSVVGAVAMFAGFGAAGISHQYLYGGLGAVSSYPHMTMVMFGGALLGRYYFARKFGREQWQNFAPILTVGFMAGMGLVGMLSIAIYFLWVAIGTGY